MDEEKYLKFEGVDFYGSDIKYSGIFDVSVLKTLCEHQENIVAFNTHGCIKHYVNINELKPYPRFGPTDCLYIHKERYANIHNSYNKFINQISDLKNSIPDSISNNEIPNIYHFIYLHGGQPFRISDFIAVKSAYEVQRPDLIFIYTDKEPENNIWWERAKKYAHIVLIDVPNVINNKKIPYFQHKADIMRLVILYEIGGIYMDLDVISLKSLDHLREHTIVMGEEGTEKLCNCVVMSRPGTQLMKKWIKTYETSYGTTELCWWAGLSTIIPKRLSSEFPEEIHKLPCEEIMPFMYNDYSIFTTEDYSNLYENSYTIHLWATEANKQNLLPDNIEYFKGTSKFAYMFKKYVEEYM
jgi:mannosyltransferase OCH1-like enzyme